VHWLPVRLVAFAASFLGLWLLIGIFISTSYHLSLYVFDGEFRQREQLAIDIFVSVLRGLAYLLLWPVILFFDRSALYRIKMLFLYYNPKERATNDELQSYIAERRHRRWVTKWYLDQSDLERRREEELVTGAERTKRTARRQSRARADLAPDWSRSEPGGRQRDRPPLS
jgi:hypothetical protein